MKSTKNTSKVIMEDNMIIYRIARAQDRRIFNINTEEKKVTSTPLGEKS